MKLKSFAEKKVDDKYEAYLEYDNGNRESCSEGKIESLWHNWVCDSSNGSYRDDKDGFTVFVYENPININH